MKERSILFRLLCVALSLAVLAPSLYFLFEHWDVIFRLIKTPENIKNYVLEYKEYGILLYVGIQIFQVVIFMIPGEVTQVAGGYLYGGFLGFILSFTGIMIGSVMAFFIGRSLGCEILRHIIPAKHFENFESVMNHKKGIMAIFLLFVLPGFPKDSLCYLSGISPINFRIFCLICAVGRLPGLILSSVFGAGLADMNYVKIIAVILVSGGFAGAGWLFRDKIDALSEKFEK